MNELVKLNFARQALMEAKTLDEIRNIRDLARAVKAYTIAKGLGVEIKYDMKYAETGNIYIEVGEKSEPRMGEYFASGIYRNDNTFLYWTGDYNEAYLFAKKHLINIHKQKKYLKFINDNSTKTSCGFLLNKYMAQSYCVQFFNLKP
jgi:hypothetical protein